MKHLIFLLFVISAYIAADAEIMTYSAPAEAKLKDSFSVEVKENDGPWLSLDTYAIKVDSAAGGKHNVVVTSMAYFDFDGEADVRVISKRQNVKDAKVRPLTKGIIPTIKGDTLLFSITRPGQFSVEVNGDIFDNLQLFANPIDSNVPANIKKWKKNRNNIYFGPGYHKLDSIMVVGSGMNVYIAGGALVDGFIHIKGDGVSISGRGMVYPSKRGAGIEIRHSKNVKAEGIFTTQCPVGDCDNVNIDNMKVMSSYGWGDGFNVFASDNVTFRNIFARTSDDCTTIYATRKGYKGGCRNIITENAVLWADVAHPFMIGLHGSAAEFGADAPADTICDIVYRNIDILDMNESQIDYQGVFAIVAGDNNFVRDITFENIWVEDFRQGKLFDIRIANNRKYCKAPGSVIENIRFKDIFYNGGNSELSLIIGYDESRKVKGIHFDNLNINGVHIYDKMPGKPGWWKTADIARIFIGEHVEDVTFE